MKTILPVLFALIGFASCKKDIPFVTETAQSASENITVAGRLNAQEKVKLYKAWSSNGYIYHGASSIKRFFYVELSNLGFNKKVFVHHKLQDGSWKDFALAYQKNIGNNAEMWVLEMDLSTNFGSTVQPPQLGNEFAIRYEVNGQVFWDNNGGTNYKMGQSDGMYLQPGLHISNDSKDSYFAYYPNATSSTFNVVADIRNLAYDKKVNVVYTTDGWKTVNKAPLQFTYNYAIGSGSSIISPNIFGIERWRTTISIKPISASRVEYALSYNVNGTEYWDNNFGLNYKLLLARY